MRELGIEKEWNGERSGDIRDSRDFRDEENEMCLNKQARLLGGKPRVTQRKR